MNDLKMACKNNKSGKYFLFIEENNDEEFLLVTPIGEVKSLEPSMFGDMDEVNVIDLLNNGLLTQQQIDGYENFVEKDSIELYEEIVRSVEDAKIGPEILQIARENMSKEQYKFILKRLVSILERLK